jgi:hypothetical protein
MNVQGFVIGQPVATGTAGSAQGMDLPSYLSQQGIDARELTVFQAGEQAKMLANPANFGGAVLDSLEHVHTSAEQFRVDRLFMPAGAEGAGRQPGPARLHPGHAPAPADNPAAQLTAAGTEYVRLLTKTMSYLTQAEMFAAIASQISRTGTTFLRGQ